MKKILFILGGIVVFGVFILLIYRYLYQGNSSNKETTANTCNQSSGDCKTKKGAVDNSSESNVNSGVLEQGIEEKNASQKSNNSDSNNSSNDDEQDVSSNESIKKFNSDKDEDETDDGVSVEVEATDE